MPRTVKPKGEVKRGTPVRQIKQAPDYGAIIVECGRMVLKNGTKPLQNSFVILGIFRSRRDLIDAHFVYV